MPGVGKTAGRGMCIRHDQVWRLSWDNVLGSVPWRGLGELSWSSGHMEAWGSKGECKLHYGLTEFQGVCST